MVGENMKNGCKEAMNYIESIFETKFNKMEADLFEYAYDKGYVKGYQEGFQQGKFDIDMDKLNKGE